MKSDGSVWGRFLTAESLWLCIPINEAIEEFRLKGKGLSFSGRMGLKQTSLALGRRIQWIGERMKGVGFGGLDWGKGKDLHRVLGEIKETRRY